MNKYQRLFKELQQERNSSPSNVNDHLMVFDGLNTFIRSFGATPAYNEDGDHIGGITGFLYSVGKTVRDFKPTRCVIVFDGRGGSAGSGGGGAIQCHGHNGAVQLPARCARGRLGDGAVQRLAPPRCGKSSEKSVYSEF